MPDEEPVSAVNYDSDDDDVLDIGLDVEENFGFDYEDNQLQENPPPKSPAIDHSNVSSKSVPQKDSRSTVSVSVSPTALRKNAPVATVVHPRNSPLEPVVTNVIINHGNFSLCGYKITNISMFSFLF